MTCNKGNICCLIKSDITALQQSAFAICPETHLLASKLLLGSVLASSIADVITLFLSLCSVLKCICVFVVYSWGKLKVDTFF